MSKKQKTEASQMSQLELLPNGPCLEICFHLNPSDLGRLCRVSKRFKTLLEDAPNQKINVWKAMCNKWGVHELKLRGITETSWKSLFTKLQKIKKVHLSKFYLICGDAYVGKSSWIKKIAYDSSDITKEPCTNLDNTVLLDLETNLGAVRFNIQTSIQVNSPESSEITFVGSNAHCAIIMFDVTRRVSYKNVPSWYREICRAHENIPIVLIANKVDSTERKVRTRHVQFHRKKNLQYYEMSVKSNYQLFKPFWYLTRKLTYANNSWNVLLTHGSGNSLDFLSTPPVSPPEVALTPAFVQELEAAVRLSEETPIFEDEEEL